jgi:hypothetical protein
MRSIYVTAALLLTALQSAQASPLQENERLWCRGERNFELFVSAVNNLGLRSLTLVNMPTKDGGTYKHGNIVEYIRSCDGYCGPGNILDTGFRYTTYFALNLDNSSIRIDSLTYPLNCQILRD